MLIVFILISMFHTVFAFSPALIEEWDETTLSHKSFLHRPIFATFWGGVRRGVHWDHPKGKMVSIQPQGFSQEISVYIQSNNEKRDLVVFYPGVFGKPNHGISPFVIDELEKNNVHVVVIPNFLAAPYLIAKPLGKGNPLEDEKSNQLFIFSEVIKRVDLKYIRGIHLIGESLGSFQALNVVSSDDKNIIKKLTLLWPPLNLKDAIERFDTIIQKSLPKFESCTYWWKWPMTFKEVKLKNVPDGLSQNDKDCLGPWIISSVFVNSIKETSKEVTEARSINLHMIPQNFREFVQIIVPEISSILSKPNKRLSIDHYLKSTRTKNLTISILSSLDDFLNRADEWGELKKNHPHLKEDIYLFSWGGHSGPMGLSGLVESLSR
jgi:hypothetical protein